VFLQNGCHVVERHGAVLALLGIDDPHNWTADDPQRTDVDAALRAAPPDAFACCWPIVPERGTRPRRAHPAHAGGTHPRWPVLPAGDRWSPGSLITKYVMGHFQRGNSQMYVSRGIGVVGVPIRVFAPPEIELFELRRG